MLPGRKHDGPYRKRLPLAIIADAANLQRQGAPSCEATGHNDRGHGARTDDKG